MNVICPVFCAVVLCISAANCAVLDRSTSNGKTDDANISPKVGANVRAKRLSDFSNIEQVNPVNSFEGASSSIPCYYSPVDGSFHNDFTGKKKSRFQKRHSNFIRIGKSSGYYNNHLNRNRRSSKKHPCEVITGDRNTDYLQDGKNWDLDNAGYMDYDESDILRSNFLGRDIYPRLRYLDAANSIDIDNALLKRANSFVRIGKSFDADKRASNFLRIGKSYEDDDQQMKRASSFVRIGKKRFDPDMFHESSKKSSSFVRIGKSPSRHSSYSLPYFVEYTPDSFLDEANVDKKASSFVRIGRSH